MKLKAWSEIKIKTSETALYVEQFRRQVVKPNNSVADVTSNLDVFSFMFGASDPWSAEKFRGGRELSLEITYRELNRLQCDLAWTCVSRNKQLIPSGNLEADCHVIRGANYRTSEKASCRYLTAVIDWTTCKGFS